MHLYTCKSLLNTLGRAVEELAGCLAKQSKVKVSSLEVKLQQHAMPARRVKMYYNKMT